MVWATGVRRTRLQCLSTRARASARRSAISRTVLDSRSAPHYGAGYRRARFGACYPPRRSYGGCRVNALSDGPRPRPQMRRRRSSSMESSYVVGGGGVQLHVVETGNARGRPILFIHGISQCWLAWSRQMDSDLAQQHRLVAMDLRGHGLSDKPPDAYGESRLWAEDVDAVIRSLGLERPILSGWSYGALVILDYLRHFGEAAVGGIHLVDAITRLGSDAALAVLTTEFLNLVPALLSSDGDESMRGLTALVRLC